MTRYNERVETTSKAIRDFAETLRLLATQLERHADFIDESKIEKITTTHWVTAKDSAEGLARFAGAIQVGAMQAKMTADLGQMTPEAKPGDAKPKKPPAKKKSP